MDAHFIAFWNVENLFGPENHPQRIDWVADENRSFLTGRTPAIYNRKLDQLARIITQMNTGAGPDILGVCEVEDAAVLADLNAKLNAALPERNYGVVHDTNEADTRGIDTAFIYDRARYSVDDNLVFAHFVIRRTGTRDILQATFKTIAHDNELVLLANHWPSRSGGAEKSAGFRATAGETLSYWHRRIREMAPDKTRAAIMALGDFNDDPFDPSIRFNAVAWRERGDIERSTSAKFYNFGWELLETQVKDLNGEDRVLNGTLYFSGDGNVFDQILAGRSLLDDGDAPFKVVDGSARIEAFPEMVSARKGEGPIRYGPGRNQPGDDVNPDGYSDHFPVSIRLLENPDWSNSA